MQKIDWIIAGVGAVALVATLLGVLYDDELTGAQDVTFSLDERTLTVASATDFATSTALETAAGMNATAAKIDVTVDFTGNAVAPQGTASVRVVVTGPDGVASEPQTAAMTIANAAGGGTGTPVTLSFDLDFGMAPANATVDDVDSLDESTSWDLPYKIEVSVTPPTDTFTGLPGAGATYTFSANASIAESYYMHRIVAPDIEGGA